MDVEETNFCEVLEKRPRTIWFKEKNDTEIAS
jgi:hypothetical protein